MEMRMKHLFGLCQGRHKIGFINQWVFPEPIDAGDIQGIQEKAESWAASLNLGAQDQVDLVVTGLTSACIAAISAARKRGVKVVLYHFNQARPLVDGKPVDGVAEVTLDDYLQQPIDW